MKNTTVLGNKIVASARGIVVRALTTFALVEVVVSRVESVRQPLADFVAQAVGDSLHQVTDQIYAVMDADDEIDFGHGFTDTLGPEEESHKDADKVEAKTRKALYGLFGIAPEGDPAAAIFHEQVARSKERSEYAMNGDTRSRFDGPDSRVWPDAMDGGARDNKGWRDYQNDDPAYW